MKAVNSSKSVKPLASVLFVPTLRDLESQGLNKAALLLMQANACKTVLLYMDEKDPKFKDEVANTLPGIGYQLYPAYTATLARYNLRDVQELELAAEHLNWRANLLERDVVKVEAGLDSFAGYHEKLGSLARVYAGVIKTAEHLYADGLTSDRVAALITRPDGPLSRIFDKAQIVIASERAQERQRIAA